MMFLNILLKKFKLIKKFKLSYKNEIYKINLTRFDAAFCKTKEC